MVRVGEKYRHFKRGRYEVIEVARDCDDPEKEVVVYRSDDGSVWVRRFMEFVGFKEIGSRKIRRFEKIPSVKVKKIKPSAVIPSYAHPGDAGMDLHSAEDYIVPAGKRQLVSTGIAMELPRGYFASIRGKSGLAYKNGISILGGVIEHTYRGEYGVVFLNTGEEGFEIKAGDKVAQVVIAPLACVDVEEVERLSESVRGDGAWGSTGA